jgi:EmrB/QacA subfamily drug resistance transporter
MSTYIIVFVWNLQCFSMSKLKELLQPSHIVPLIVASAFFMENLDGSVINTALPQMALSMGVSAVDMSIGITSYLITLAAFIPVSGWFADRFGAQRVFGSAVAVFTLASIGCALSDSVHAFTLARILQGMGGAMMVPVGRLIVLRITPKDQLVKVVALITWPGLMAPIVGPPLGGFITTYFSWHYIFYLNVPLGLIGLWLIKKYISNQSEQSKRPLDFIGFLLIGLGLASFVMGVESLGNEGLTVRCGELFLACALLGLLAWVHTKRHPSPLLNFSVLRVHTFGIIFFWGSLTRVCIGATPFLAPLMFQVAFGYNAFASGLLLLSAMLGNLGLKPFTPKLLRRFGFRTILLGNGCLAACAAFAIGLLSPNASVVLIAMVMLVYGITRSMQFTCIQTMAFADVPSEQMSGANTLFSTMAQLTQGVGVALGATIIHASVYLRQGDINHPQTNDFTLAFSLVGALILVSLLGYRGLRLDAGASVSKHEKFQIQTSKPSTPTSTS